MGVIRRTIKPKAIRIEECNEEFAYTNYDLTESDAESLHNARVVATASKTQKKKECRESRRLRRFHDSVESGGVTMRKHMGQRKWRRVENARFLLSMIDREDIVDDFSDMVERTVTAFDELFNDSAKTAVWNDFIAKDEVEQVRLLEEARCITRKEAGGVQPGSWFRVGGRREAKIEDEKRVQKGEEKEEKNDEGIEDKRRHHPAYSASSCFARLSPKLRNFFYDKSLPWPLIDRVDQELREFFNGLPDGRWRRPIDNSRHRLAIHAVSAFLMLSSKTCRDADKDVVEMALSPSTARRLQRVNGTVPLDMHVHAHDFQRLTPPIIIIAGHLNPITYWNNPINYQPMQFHQQQQQYQQNLLWMQHQHQQQQQQLQQQQYLLWMQHQHQQQQQQQQRALQQQQHAQQQQQNLLWLSPHLPLPPHVLPGFRDYELELNRAPATRRRH